MIMEMLHMSVELKFQPWLSMEEGRNSLNLPEILTSVSRESMFEEPTARH